MLSFIYFFYFLFCHFLSITFFPFFICIFPLGYFPNFSHFLSLLYGLFSQWYFSFKEPRSGFLCFSLIVFFPLGLYLPFLSLSSLSHYFLSLTLSSFTSKPLRTEGIHQSVRLSVTCPLSVCWLLRGLRGCLSRLLFVSLSVGLWDGKQVGLKGR